MNKHGVRARILPMYDGILTDINPSQVFRETLKLESGKADADLRASYAEALADRIQKRMPQAELSDFDFDSFFECAVDATFPIRLEKEGADYYATAVDVPELVSEVCAELTANQKQALCLHCLKTAITKEAVELEIGDHSYKASSIAAETPKKGKNHNAIRKFFAAALISATAFLASASAQAETILGTQIALSTDRAGAYQTQLLRGQNDRVFSRSGVLKRQMDIFKKKDFQGQISAVHAFWNGFEYKSDPQLWGKPDHWATTSEFLRKKGGDCEDFALTKYWTLRALGIPAERMRVLVGDRIQEGIAHAVLAVKDDAGKVWILDNLEKGVVSEADMYLKFAPRFSVSETEKRVCLPTPDFKKALAEIDRGNFNEDAAPAGSVSVSMNP